MTADQYDRVYRWGNNPARAALKGKRCRVVETGSSKLSVLIEFEDGQRIVTSKRSLGWRPGLRRGTD